MDGQARVAGRGLLVCHGSERGARRVRRGRDRVTEAAGRSARLAGTAATVGSDDARLDRCAAASMSAASIAARNAGSAARTGRPMPRPEAERAPADPDEGCRRAGGSRMIVGDRHELADRQDVRRARDRARPRRRVPGASASGDGHDRARAQPDDRVDDDAGAAVGQLEQVLELELLAAADLEDGQQVRRQPGQQPGDRGQRRAVVAAIGVAADEQADGPRGGHDRSSTRRSRKWVAHEMHGS